MVEPISQFWYNAHYTFIVFRVSNHSDLYFEFKAPRISNRDNSSSMKGRKRLLRGVVVRGPRPAYSNRRILGSPMNVAMLIPVSNAPLTRRAPGAPRMEASPPTPR